MSDADFTTTLSSELIAEVMERYFNKEMYKKKVKVVDLKMSQDMCMFGLTWVIDDIITPMEGDIKIQADEDFLEDIQNYKVKRSNNGRFAKT